MRCSKCLKEHSSEEFSFKNKQKNLRQKICKNCHSLYRKSHYLQNKEKYIAKALKWNKKQGKVLASYIFDKLARSECIDCGEKDIVVLEFDHIINKKLGIANMYKNRYFLKSIQEELAKCVVRCANCHRRKTAKESGFWKYRMSELIK